MACKEREETKSEQELIDDYDNMESEAVQSALNSQKKKWNKNRLISIVLKPIKIVVKLPSELADPTQL